MRWKKNKSQIKSASIFKSNPMQPFSNQLKSLDQPNLYILICIKYFNHPWLEHNSACNQYFVLILNLEICHPEGETHVTCHNEPVTAGLNHTLTLFYMWYGTCGALRSGSFLLIRNNQVLAAKSKCSSCLSNVSAI